MFVNMNHNWDDITAWIQTREQGYHCILYHPVGTFQCPLCYGDPEDRIHFILLCPALSESRDRHLRIIRALYTEV